MRLSAFLVLILSVTQASADSAPEQQIDSHDRARIEQAIKDAYSDPRVAQVIEQAQREKRSVSVALDTTAPSDFAMAPSTDVALPTSTTVTAPVTVINEVTPAPAANQADEPSWWNAYNHLGVLLDAGVPDGIGASAVFRPFKWVRVHAGGTYNGISGGIRAGVTVLPPVFFPILPTATVEVGHVFEGDANWIARKFASDPEFDNPSLRRVSYDYVNGHLGLEFGSQKSFLFYIHGGVSYLGGTIKDFQKSIDQSGSNSGDTTITAKDPNVSMLIPSGKIGFILYFL